MKYTEYHADKIRSFFEMINVYLYNPGKNKTFQRIYHTEKNLINSKKHLVIIFNLAKL